VTAVVGISGGESSASRTRALTQAILEAAGGGELVDLSDLRADGLLGRSADPDVDAAVALASSADVVVLASPIYRATVSGAVKAFLDRFPAEGLRGTVVVLAATAATEQHHLALDTGGRALVASLGGVSAPTVVFGTSADFTDGAPGGPLLAVAARAAAEALALSRGDLRRV
jgi:FMN reductase